MPTKQVWTQADDAVLKSEVERLVKDKVFYKLTRPKIVAKVAAKLGRSPRTTEVRMVKLGIHTGDRANKWSEEDLADLKELALKYYGEGKLIDEIGSLLAPRFRRTEEAVKTKISALRVLPRKQQRWGKEEQTFLLCRVGDRPLPELTESLNGWRKRHGLKPRTQACVAGWLIMSGVSMQVCSDNIIALPDLALALRCSQNKIRHWLRKPELETTLQPVQHDSDRNGSEYARVYFRTENLKEFFMRYPIAIDGLAPDMLWFMDVMATEKRAKGEKVA